MSKFPKKIIRFRSKGFKHYRLFEIIVSYHTKSRNGSYIERIGFYNPNKSEKMFFINILKLGSWLNKGAFLSSKVKRLLRNLLFV